MSSPWDGPAGDIPPTYSLLVQGKFVQQGHSRTIALLSVESTVSKASCLFGVLDTTEVARSIACGVGGRSLVFLFFFGSVLF